MKALIFGASLALPFAVEADTCDQGNLTGFDSVHCFAAAYQDLDNRLNSTYGALLELLTDEESDILRQAQRTWISAREGSCMSGPTTADVSCVLELTRDRVNVLAERIDECKSVGCQTQRLHLLWRY